MGWFERAYRSLIGDLRELKSKALRSGFAEGEIMRTLFEEVEVESDEDYRKLIHDDIPETLRKLLEKAGLRECRVYRKKDAVAGAEYIAECRYPEPIVVEMETDFDWFDEDLARVDLLFVKMEKGRLSPDIKPYYREV